VRGPQPDLLLKTQCSAAFAPQTKKEYHCGSVVAALEKGLYRGEGKDSSAQDGNVLLFKLNV